MLHIYIYDISNLSVKFLKCEYAPVMQFITDNFLASSLCKIVRTCEKNERGPPMLLFNGYWASILGVKQEKRERNLYQSVPWLNEWSYTSTPPPHKPSCRGQGQLHLYPMNHGV